MIRRLLALLITAAFCMSVSAYDFKEGALFYSVNADGTSVSVVRECVPYGNYDGLSANVVIPSQVTHDGVTYPVTAIGFMAFSHCSIMKQVTIPESVTTIENSAFEQSGLTSVTVPSSVTTMGGSEFWCCQSLISANLPATITELQATFEGCTSLGSIDIPESVTTIKNAFRGCTALTTITIPEQVAFCGGEAFEGCTALKTVNWNAKRCSSGNSDNVKPIFGGANALTAIVFGDEVENIPNGLCKGLYSLTSVALPESVVEIGTEAFYNCSSLSDITFGSAVKTIGRDAFASTDWFNNQSAGLIYIGQVAYKYKGSMPSGTELTINEGCTSIADACFNRCERLKAINLPQSLELIGESAFAGCKTLASVVIPDNVLNIGEFAFSRCELLKSVSFGSSLERIGRSAFSNCLITSVVIPDNVLSIGRSAFNHCNLQSVVIGKSVECIGDESFPNDPNAFGENSGLTSIIVDEANTTFDSREGCNALIETATNTLITGCSTTTIPNTVTAIGRRAFYACSQLTEIKIPVSVTEIGIEAFRKAGLIKVVIPEGVTVIPSYLFENCYRLESATLPLRVREVGECVFKDCIALEEVTIPEGCTEIKWKMFSGCNALKTVKCYAVNPPSIEYDFINYDGCTLHVPIATLQNYSTTIPWSGFSTIIDDLVRVGDLDANGTINVSDVNLIVSGVLIGGENELYDINEDGNVNVSDVNIIVSKALRE